MQFKPTNLSVGLIALVFFGVSGFQSRADLIINLTNGGGTAPTTTGAGTLSTVMRAAADVWQLAFNSNSFSHSLNIEYRWEGLSGGTLGVHSLTTQSGTPNRETAGLIRFDNSGSSSFFLDGTLNAGNPIFNGNSEYTTYTETTQNFGGGSMNKGRVFTVATGDAVGQTDMFSVALHEIGHALGLSSANTSYGLETSGDNDVDITSPLMFAGSAIPTNNSGPTLNAHLNISTALMFPSIGTGLRRLPSAADIFANAQLSQFFNPNFNLTAIPEPSFATVGFAFLVSGMAIRRRKSYRS